MENHRANKTTRRLERWKTEIDCLFGGFIGLPHYVRDTELKNGVIEAISAVGQYLLKVSSKLKTKAKPLITK